jgi:hypothetical protein
MTSIQTRREQVLAQAVVSAYINELATSSSRPDLVAVTSAPRELSYRQ